MSAERQVPYDFWDQSYYKTTKSLSCFIGQWPYQTTREITTRRLGFAILYMMQIIPQCLAVRRYYNDFEIVMESSGPFLINVFSTLNVTSLIANFQQMRHLLDEIRENWEMVTEKYGRHLCQEYAETNGKLTFLYAAVIYSATILICFQPLQIESLNHILGLNRTVPMFFMELDYPGIDIVKYRYLLILISTIAISMIITATVVYDLMFFLYTQHLCGLFAALGYAIENMPIPLDNEEYGRIDETYEHTRYCIRIHNRAINFARQMENIYTWHFLELLGINISLLCFAVFEIAVNSDALMKMAKYLVFVGSGITHIYILCYISQKVMDHSLGLQKHIQNSNWFRSSLKTQKLLRFMMMRCQIPCQLTAGKVIIMSLETFTVVKTSASYFTVLLAMQ